LNDKYKEVLKLKEDLDYAKLLRETEGINRYQEKIIQFAKG
jgi:DNA polymerase III alpha subunit